MLMRLRRLGLAGSVTLFVGGVLAGVPPMHDPVLQSAPLKALRAWSTPTVLIVFAGICMLMLAWWRLGRLVRGTDPTEPVPTTRELMVTMAWWGAPLLLTMPIFSRDVYSYLAQGTMTVFGLDAYHFGPAVMGGPLTVDIPSIWQTTPAPYGPVFLNLAADVTKVTGESIWFGVLGMRLLALLGLGLIVVSVPFLADFFNVDRRIAFWLGVLNPLVLIHLIGDAHNDALMIGLMMAGLALAVRRRPDAGAVLVTLAALVKAPAGLALVFIVPIWAEQLSGRARWLRAGFAAGGIGIATVVVVTTLAGTGYGWVAALDIPTLAHTWTSLTTDIGYWLGMAASSAGVATEAQVLAWVRLAGLAASGAICLVMLRKHRATPIIGLGLGLAAVLALGPVVHPWYLLWAIIPLATAAKSAKIQRGIIIASIAMTAMVLPGGVSPVPDVFLGALLGAAIVFGTAWAARNVDWTDVLGSARGALRQVLQREPVAVHAEAADHAGGDRGDHRMVPERFARVDVGNVHLDERAP